MIENEFGEISIDDALVKDKFKDKEEIFEMNNGCICCTVRGDLIRILGKLAERKDKFDYVRPSVCLLCVYVRVCVYVYVCVPA